MDVLYHFYTIMMLLFLAVIAYLIYYVFKTFIIPTTKQTRR
jgi:hypothetical protein